MLEVGKATSPSRDPRWLFAVSDGTNMHFDLLTAIYGVDGCKCDEESKQSVVSLDAIQTESQIIHDGHGIFSTVDEMWENVHGIPVSPDAL